MHSRQTIIHILLALWAVTSATGLFSCSASYTAARSGLKTGNNYCAPAISYIYDARFRPLENIDTYTGDSALTARIPEHDLYMANATGTLPLMMQLLQARKDSSTEGRMRVLELNTQIQQRLTWAVTEISAIAAEMDCEGERVEQFAVYLDNLNARKNTRLTVSSIIVGSLTTVATVVIKNNTAQNAVGIGGGLLSAGLGALTIPASSKKITLEHPRNLLQDIWLAPAESGVYSPFLWYVLNEKNFSNGRQHSLVHSIRDRWYAFEFNQKIDSLSEKKLFGQGGPYTAGDLHTRANMLNQLQSTVRSIHQDMQNLMATLYRITYTDPK